MTVNEMREAIKGMAPGPEMDLLVAGFLGNYPNARRGWRQDIGPEIFFYDEPGEGLTPTQLYDHPEYGETCLPLFSTGYSVALIALHAVRGEKDAVRVSIDSLHCGGWGVHLEPRNEIATYTAEESTLSLAICRACLLYAAGRPGFHEIYQSLLH